MKSNSNMSFLWCDCGFYDSIGIPCVHIFRLTGEMTLNMFHIRHWRYYKAYYNDDTEIGRQLVKAQNEHFDNEGLGVRLSKDQIIHCFKMTAVSDVLKMGPNWHPIQH